MPPAWGAKVTLIVQVKPAPRLKGLKGQLLVSEKLVDPAVTPMLEMENAEVPVFPIVRTSAELDRPTVTLGNESVVTADPL